MFKISYKVYLFNFIIFEWLSLSPSHRYCFRRMLNPMFWALPKSCVNVNSVSIKKNKFLRLIMRMQDSPSWKISDKSLTFRDLEIKLNSIWQNFGPWKIVSLGHGYYEKISLRNDKTFSLRVPVITILVRRVPLRPILNETVDFLVFKFVSFFKFFF
jgi:hypothetical protein